LVELAREPESTVQADGDLKREPRLHAQVHEPELGVLIIKVVMQALARPQLEMKPVRGVVAVDEVSQARRDDIEEPDKPLAHAVARRDGAGQFFFAERGGVQVTHRSALAGGEGVRGSADAVAHSSGVGPKSFRSTRASQR